MRFKKSRQKLLEGDLTPMIDMAFQLIAFFMLLINFSEIEKTEEVNLPDSVIAKPPEVPPEFPILLNLDDDGTCSLGAEKVDNLDTLGVLLSHEISMASRQSVGKGQINVIIRADRDAPTGEVRKLMKRCQESGLETFSLRVKSQVR